MDVVQLQGLDELHQGVRHFVHGIVHGHGAAGKTKAHQIQGDHVVFLRQQRDKIPPGVQALSQGKIDAVVIDNQPALEFVKDAEGLKILETPYTEEDYAMCFQKDSALVEDFNAVIKELQDEQGEYTHEKAALHYNKHILDEKADNMLELRYTDRKRIHNLKYYTWVEQQGKTVDEINALWYDEANTWGALRKEASKVDELINEFNEATGLLKNL